MRHPERAEVMQTGFYCREPPTDVFDKPYAPFIRNRGDEKN